MEVLFMGLDAYIFRIERPTEEELKKLSDLSLSEINDLGYNYIEAEAFERNLDLYQSVIWHARRITAKNKGFNQGDCFKAHGIDITQPYRSHKAGEGMVVFLKTKTITLTKEDIEPYTYWEDCDIYVFKLETLAYWKNDFEINDFFMLRTDIDNCGYYSLEPEDREELKKFLQKRGEEDFDTSVLDNYDMDLFYYAWW